MKNKEELIKLLSSKDKEIRKIGVSYIKNNFNLNFMLEDYMNSYSNASVVFNDIINYGYSDYYIIYLINELFKHNGIK